MAIGQHWGLSIRVNARALNQLTSQIQGIERLTSALRDLNAVGRNALRKTTGISESAIRDQVKQVAVLKRDMAKLQKQVGDIGRSGNTRVGGVRSAARVPMAKSFSDDRQVRQFWQKMGVAAQALDRIGKYPRRHGGAMPTPHSVGGQGRAFDSRQVFSGILKGVVVAPIVRAIRLSTQQITRAMTTAAVKTGTDALARIHQTTIPVKDRATPGIARQGEIRETVDKAVRDVQRRTTSAPPKRRTPLLTLAERREIQAVFSKKAQAERLRRRQSLIAAATTSPAAAQPAATAVKASRPTPVAVVTDAEQREIAAAFSPKVIEDRRRRLEEARRQAALAKMPLFERQVAAASGKARKRIAPPVAITSPAPQKRSALPLNVETAFSDKSLFKLISEATGADVTPQALVPALKNSKHLAAAFLMKNQNIDVDTQKHIAELLAKSINNAERPLGQDLARLTVLRNLGPKQFKRIKNLSGFQPGTQEWAKSLVALADQIISPEQLTPYLQGMDVQQVRAIIRKRLKEPKLPATFDRFLEKDLIESIRRTISGSTQDDAVEKLEKDIKKRGKKAVLADLERQARGEPILTEDGKPKRKRRTGGRKAARTILAFHQGDFGLSAEMGRTARDAADALADFERKLIAKANDAVLRGELHPFYGNKSPRSVPQFITKHQDWIRGILGVAPSTKLKEFGNRELHSVLSTSLQKWLQKRYPGMRDKHKPLDLRSDYLAEVIASVGARNRAINPTNEMPPGLSLGNAPPARGSRLAGRLRSATERVAMWGAGGMLVYGGFSAMRDGIRTMTEFEDKLVRLEKVMNPLEKDMGRLSRAAQDLGKQFGASVIDVADAMVIYAQQGRKVNDIIDQTRTALVAANITEMSVVDAVEALTAAQLQFQMSSRSSMKVLDAWNEVENTTAINAKELAEATKQAATVARHAGIDFHTFNGIVAAIGESTRKSGEEIGTSLKFIFQHIYEDDAVEALQNAGIYIQDLQGNFQSARSILGQLANAWDTLSDVQKHHIAVSIAGTRRLNDFFTLMDHWDRALDVGVTSLNSQGSALKENDRAMRSLAKQQDQLAASYQSLWVSLGQSGALGTLKQVVNVLRTITDLLGQVGNGFGAFGGGMTGVALTGGMALSGLAMMMPFGLGASMSLGEPRARPSYSMRKAMRRNIFSPRMGGLGVMLAANALSQAYNQYTHRDEPSRAVMTPMDLASDIGTSVLGSAGLVAITSRPEALSLNPLKTFRRNRMFGRIGMIYAALVLANNTINTVQEFRRSRSPTGRASASSNLMQAEEQQLDDTLSDLRMLRKNLTSKGGSAGNQVDVDFVNDLRARLEDQVKTSLPLFGDIGLQDVDKAVQAVQQKSGDIRRQRIQQVQGEIGRALQKAEQDPSQRDRLLQMVRAQTQLSAQLGQGVNLPEGHLNQISRLTGQTPEALSRSMLQEYLLTRGVAADNIGQLLGRAGGRTATEVLQQPRLLKEIEGIASHFDGVARITQKKLEQLVSEYQRSVSQLVDANNKLMQNVEFSAQTLKQESLLRGEGRGTSNIEIRDIMNSIEALSSIQGNRLEGLDQITDKNFRDRISKVTTLIQSSVDQGIGVGGLLDLHQYINEIGNQQIRQAMDAVERLSTLTKSDIEGEDLAPQQQQARQQLVDLLGGDEAYNRVYNLIAEAATARKQGDTDAADRSMRLVRAEVESATRVMLSGLNDTLSQATQKQLGNIGNTTVLAAQTFGQRAFMLQQTGGNLDNLFNSEPFRKAQESIREFGRILGQEQKKIEDKLQQDDLDIGTRRQLLESLDQLRQKSLALAPAFQDLEQAARDTVIGMAEQRRQANVAIAQAMNGKAFGLTGTAGLEFALDFLKEAGAKSKGQAQEQIAQSRSQVETQLAVRRAIDEQMQQGLRQAVMTNAITGKLGLSVSGATQGYIQTQREQIQATIGSAVRAVAERLGNRFNSLSPDDIRAAADAVRETLGPAADAIEEFARKADAQFRRSYLLASDTDRALADAVEAQLQAGASIEEIFADPRMRMAAKDSPLLQQIMDRGLQGQLDLDMLHTQQQIQANTATSAEIQKAILQALQSRGSYASGTFAAIGTQAVDGKGRIRHDGTPAMLHKGEVVLNKRQVDALFQNQYAKGTDPDSHLLQQILSTDAGREPPLTNKLTRQAREFMDQRFGGKSARLFDVAESGEKGQQLLKQAINLVAQRNQLGIGRRPMKQLLQSIDIQAAHVPERLGQTQRFNPVRLTGYGFDSVGIDPKKIGVIRISAGQGAAHLGDVSAVASTVEHELHHVLMQMLSNRPLKVGGEKLNTARTLQKALRAKLTAVVLSNVDPNMVRARHYVLQSEGYQFAQALQKLGPAKFFDSSWGFDFADEVLAQYVSLASARNKPISKVVKAIRRQGGELYLGLYPKAFAGSISPDDWTNKLIKAYQQLIEDINRSGYTYFDPTGINGVEGVMAGANTFNQRQLLQTFATQGKEGVVRAMASTGQFFKKGYDLTKLKGQTLLDTATRVAKSPVTQEVLQHLRMVKNPSDFTRLVGMYWDDLRYPVWHGRPVARSGSPRLVWLGSELSQAQRGYLDWEMFQKPRTFALNRAIIEADIPARLRNLRRGVGMRARLMLRSGRRGLGQLVTSLMDSQALSQLRRISPSTLGGLGYGAINLADLGVQLGTSTGLIGQDTMAGYNYYVNPMLRSAINYETATFMAAGRGITGVNATSRLVGKFGGRLGQRLVTGQVGRSLGTLSRAVGGVAAPAAAVDIGRQSAVTGYRVAHKIGLIDDDTLQTVETANSGLVENVKDFGKNIWDLGHRLATGDTGIHSVGDFFNPLKNNIFSVTSNLLATGRASGFHQELVEVEREKARIRDELQGMGASPWNPFGVIKGGKWYNPYDNSLLAYWGTRMTYGSLARQRIADRKSRQVMEDKRQRELAFQRRMMEGEYQRSWAEIETGLNPLSLLRVATRQQQDRKLEEFVGTLNNLRDQGLVTQYREGYEQTRESIQRLLASLGYEYRTGADPDQIAQMQQRVTEAMPDLRGRVSELQDRRRSIQSMVEKLQNIWGELPPPDAKPPTLDEATKTSLQQSLRDAIFHQDDKSLEAVRQRVSQIRESLVQQSQNTWVGFNQDTIDHLRRQLPHAFEGELNALSLAKVSVPGLDNLPSMDPLNEMMQKIAAWQEQAVIDRDRWTKTKRARDAFEQAQQSVMHKWEAPNAHGTLEPGPDGRTVNYIEYQGQKVNLRSEAGRRLQEQANQDQVTYMYRQNAGFRFASRLMSEAITGKLTEDQFFAQLRESDRYTGYTLAQDIPQWAELRDRLAKAQAMAGTPEGDRKVFEAMRQQQEFLSGHPLRANAYDRFLEALDQTRRVTRHMGGPVGQDETVITRGEWVLDRGMVDEFKAGVTGLKEILARHQTGGDLMTSDARSFLSSMEVNTNGSITHTGEITLSADGGLEDLFTQLIRLLREQGGGVPVTAPRRGDRIRNPLITE